MPTDPQLSSFGKVKVAFSRRLYDSWEDVADLVEVPTNIKTRWRTGDGPRELWEWLEVRGRLGRLPDALIAVHHPDLAAAVAALPADVIAVRDDGEPARRNIRPLPVALAAGLLVAITVVAGLWIFRWQAPDRPPYKYLHLEPLRGDTGWGEQLNCVPAERYTHKFPPGFRGDVYVQITADPRKVVHGLVKLAWGGGYWDNGNQPIDISPGDVASYRGGTLLRFLKKDVDDGPPAEVVFTSGVPVCAVFGTASDPATSRPALVQQTPGWIYPTR